MMRILFLGALTFVFSMTMGATGCLKTRAEIDAEQSGGEQQRQTNTQQQKAREDKPYKEKAPATAYKFEEYDEQMRALVGRVDGVENRLELVTTSATNDRIAVNKNTQIIDQRFVAYEEAIKKLETQVSEMSEEVSKLKATSVAPPTPSQKLTQPDVASGGKLRTPYDEGEDHFNAHKWKEAILNYQKYRDSSPKGKFYPDSTYKIGVCFQELGMKDEARSFYEEVTAKFPKSKEAKKAVLRMKSLK